MELKAYMDDTLKIKVQKKKYTEQPLWSQSDKDKQHKCLKIDIVMV